jgi:hypothetical protein
MIPKEKAKELVYKYLPLLYGKKPYYKNSDLFKCKQCALIAIDEILNNDNNFFNTYSQNDYWLQVKQEIEKL